MISSGSDCTLKSRRCLLTFKPFRIFVAGIGFFSLCFLMTSLGGQFSAKRLGDSPFTIRAEVLGGLESRGVLKKISDMLEVIMKRIDGLSRLGNTSDSHRLEELSSALDRFQPMGLVERIQAIAQNVSDMAVKVEQILQRSQTANKVRDSLMGQCDVPKDPHYPDCPSKMDAALRSDLGPLLEQVGTGKESLSFMRRRIRRLAAQWASAARRLDGRLRSQTRQQKRILVHMGFLTEESGDMFSPKVLKGGPLGEMVQWADILSALHVLGHSLKISSSVKELQGFLGVPPGRGSCPLTGPFPFDLVYTDYHGLQQIKQLMGLSLKKYRCHMRVIDTFGTEPAYSHEQYATHHNYRSNWGYWNLDCRQFMTMFPHTPDNSFMGFVAEELNETERRSIQKNKVANMAVVYGKEASMWKLRGKESFLTILNRYMEIHGTVYYETQRPPEVPAFVKNHGLLPQHELQQLLRKAKLFIGFGFPYEGPAPLEAIANGCVFLQPRFQPPHSSLNHEFFRGKPTSREVSSQHPYAEQYIGRPHVMTVDFNNSQEFEAAIQEIMTAKVEPYLPYEYTCEGMLERVSAYIEHQNFCHPGAQFPPVNASRSWPGNPPSPFVLLPNTSTMVWAPNVTAPPCWPPLSAMQLLLATEGLSCVRACQEENLVCEPAFFPYVNNLEAFSGLQVQCEALEEEVNHLYPAASLEEGECFLQKEPLLYSCAGAGPKHRRLCPCRDFVQGQEALCRDCL